MNEDENGPASTVNDFKKQVSTLRTKVLEEKKAAAASAAPVASASASSSGGPPQKKHKGPIKLTVPTSGLTIEMAQRLCPPMCMIASSDLQKCWRSWWTGELNHLGNRSRAWGQYGHHQACIELLRCVWTQYTEDGQGDCPHEGMFP